MPDLQTHTRVLGAFLAMVVFAGVGCSDCPHEVIDDEFVAQTNAATACSLMQNMVGMERHAVGVPCTNACGRAVTYCDPSQEYQSAFEAAQPDAGASQCPDVNGTVGVDCVISHSEGSQTDGCPVEGRRPAGLADSPTDPGAESNVGRWLAACAHLEAASVFAFDTLARELATHRAPTPLVAAARRARREEARHARVVGAQARRFGAVPPRARASRRPPRPLVDVAIENAVEGVVRETFGAASALWRSRQAEDEAIRETASTIAHEECGHAALAWLVHEWAMTRLDTNERGCVIEAMHGAIEELRVACRAEPSTDLCHAAGVPTTQRALAWIDALARKLEVVDRDGLGLSTRR